MLLLLTILCAHAEWQEIATSTGCTIYKGPLEGDIQPIRANCVWNVPLQQVQEILSDQRRQVSTFSTLRQSVPLDPPMAAPPSGTQWAYQVHGVSGAPEREVVVKITSEQTESAWRQSWTRAEDQSELIGLVEIQTIDGFWELTATDRNTTQLTYETRYKDAGRLPERIGRAFQISRAKQMLTELATSAEVH